MHVFIVHACWTSLSTLPQNGSVRYLQAEKEAAEKAKADKAAAAAQKEKDRSRLDGIRAAAHPCYHLTCGLVPHAYSTPDPCACCFSFVEYY